MPRGRTGSAAGTLLGGDAIGADHLTGAGILGDQVVAAGVEAVLVAAGDVALLEALAQLQVEDAVAELERTLELKATTDNLSACRGADVVLVCLKPQRYAAILDTPEMREALAGKLLISIAAGVTLDKLAQWLPDTAVIRAMPNTPTRVLPSCLI